MNIFVKDTKEFGRGLYTFTSILSHREVMRCELLVLSESDSNVVNATELRNYTFKYNETQDCLVLGNGELFNHSIRPNIGYRIEEVGGRMMMSFYSLRTIEPDEQLFIDYSQDENIDMEAYINNPSLIGYV